MNDKKDFEIINIDTKIERYLTSIIRSSILKRDEHKCKVCGSEHYLEVHHILAIRYGGKSTEDNLITLCKACHKFAPEDGKRSMDAYIDNKNEYIIACMNDIPELRYKKEKMFIKYKDMLLEEYTKNNLITEKQKLEILNYEIEKIFNHLLENGIDIRKVFHK